MSDPRAGVCTAEEVHSPVPELLEAFSAGPSIGSVSWLDFKLARLREWWETHPDADMVRGIATLLSFVAPELAGAMRLRTVVATSRLGNEEYLWRLRRYMARPSRRVRVKVEWGHDARSALDGAMGHFKLDGTVAGAAELALRVEGDSRLAIHHEMWHWRNFLRNFDADVEGYFLVGEQNATRATKIIAEDELFVHAKLAGSRRWSSYSDFERYFQTEYARGWKQRLDRAIDKLGIPGRN